MAIPPELMAELPHHLYTYHGFGAGRSLTAVETRAVLACRLASLSQGLSAVSWTLLQQLEHLLAHDILPIIPAEGSVGASGDLTPLSYVAAVLCGEREVLWQGERMPAAQALQRTGAQPLKLRPKEGLALMNGTAVMTALACLAWLVDTRYRQGLPSNLSAVQGPRQAINHGLKALQISVTAWTAEALKQTMPASVFSRSTECHQQDKVSMGTIAARAALRVLELTEQVVAAMLISARQAVVLRQRVQDYVPVGETLNDWGVDLAQRVALVEEDRALGQDLQRLIADVRDQAWSLYDGAGNSAWAGPVGAL